MAVQILIVAAVLCMYGLRELEPLIPVAQHPGLGLALVAMQIVFVTLLALLLNRIGLRRLARTGKAQGELGGFYRRLGFGLHIVLLLLFAGDIYLAGWADLAESLSARSRIVGNYAFFASGPAEVVIRLPGAMLSKNNAP